jgi:MFS family permease
MKIANTFPAFREKNIRLFFYAQLISLAGTYLQATAQGWLVFQLTHSAFWVGVVSGLALFPIFIFVLFGGVLVDRFDRRKILYFTQIMAMLLAFILGILTLTHQITVWEICILSLLLGIVNALDNPARAAFTSDMVQDKANFASAISLYSGTNNLAMAVGPAIAGLLIVIIGTGWTFIINGFTFLAILAALYLMEIKERITEEKDIHPITMIKDGLKYFITTKGLFFITLIAGAMAFFGRAYISIFPVIAAETYNGAKALGVLLSAFGIGAALGAIVSSFLVKKIQTKKLIIFGNILIGLDLLVFAFTSNLFGGFILATLSGWAVVFEAGIIVIIIQHTVSEIMRGRVMSIFYFIFYGGFSLGSFFIGWMSSVFGLHLALEFDGVVLLLMSAAMIFFKERILELEN